MSEDYTPKKPIIFYDGECGLCHRFVKTALAFDKTGVVNFAPLQGETLKRLLTTEEIAALPDSLVFHIPAAGLKNHEQVEHRKNLITFEAVRAALRLIEEGNQSTLLRLITTFLSIIPRPIGDAAYRLITKARKKIFSNPTKLCPIVPETIRNRFLR